METIFQWIVLCVLGMLIGLFLSYRQLSKKYVELEGSLALQVALNDAIRTKLNIDVDANTRL